MTKPKKGSSSSPEVGGNAGSIDFMLRTAMERACSNKRPIRPKLVESELLGDDTDDSDFNVDDDVMENSNSESGSHSDDSSNTNNNDSRDDENSENESESEDEDDKKTKKPSLRETLQKLNEEETIKRPKKKKVTKKTKKKVGVVEKKAKKVTVAKKAQKVKKAPKAKEIEKTRRLNSQRNSVFDRVFRTSSAINEIRSDIDLKKKICSFCLGEKSDANNEIIECDSCKISIHEGCYGINESGSETSSTSSSSSTEPWFCDYCKDPDKKNLCVVCPVSGGILKATAEGGFIHLLCAHYTPGIVWVGGLYSVSQIPSSKWGLKPCVLCISSRFSLTGVTVKCDAGMCKAHLHVSCAQKFGLLSSPNLGDLAHHDEADPFFASCKAHGNKEEAKHRAKQFKVLQEQIRIKREKSESGESSASGPLARVREKLSKIRKKVEEERDVGRRSGRIFVLPSHFKSPPKVLTENCLRRPRAMRSCANSVSRFLHKIENMGEDITSLELEEKSERIVANIKKRWNVLPSLSVEFAAYYFDREARIESMSSLCSALLRENEKLNDSQTALSLALETGAVSAMELADSTAALAERIRKLREAISYFTKEGKSGSGGRGSWVSTGISSSSPRTVRGTPKASEIKGRAAQVANSTNKIGTTKNKLPVVSGRLSLNKCAVCSKTDKQHLITKCDKCSKHYHLHCLDPPLLKMPARSSYCGWVCSDCVEEEDELYEEKEESEVVDLQAPRSLRGRTSIKRPEKYRESGNEDYDDYLSKLKNNSSFSSTSSTSSPLLSSSKKDASKTINSLSPSGSNKVDNTSSKRKKEKEASASPPSKRARIEIKKSKLPPKASNNKDKAKNPTTKKDERVRRSKESKINATNNKAEEKREKKVRGANSPKAGEKKKSEMVEEIKEAKVMLKGSDVLKQKSSPHSPLSPSLDSLKKNNTRRAAASSNSPLIRDNTTKKELNTSSTSPTSNSFKNVFDGMPPELNLSQETTDALLNSSNISSSSMGTVGTCAVCSKSEDKKQLVMCDECGNDFHFVCVPPFVPYNPKRRGYKWACEKCLASLDEDTTS